MSMENSATIFHSVGSFADLWLRRQPIADMINITNQRQIQSAVQKCTCMLFRPTSEDNVVCKKKRKCAHYARKDLRLKLCKTRATVEIIS